MKLKTLWEGMEGVYHFTLWDKERIIYENSNHKRLLKTMEMGREIDDIVFMFSFDMDQQLI